MLKLAKDGTLTRRALTPGELAQIGTVKDVCRVLSGWGVGDLAERLAYLASAEDQAEDEVPATLESSLGFLAFYGQVSAQALLNLTCSPEGWICAEWDFADGSSVGLWFTDCDNVMSVATNPNGDFVDIDVADDNSGQAGLRRTVTQRLVREGFFAWV